MTLPPLAELEQATHAFYDWELRGRGWTTYPSPVVLEPPFRPYQRYIPKGSVVDDGRRPGIVERFFSFFRPPTPPLLDAGESDQEDAPRAQAPVPLLEQTVLIPEDTHSSAAACQAWIRASYLASHPIAFELVGHSGSVTTRLTLAVEDAPLVLDQLRAHHEEVILPDNTEPLTNLWSSTINGFALEFGLAEEFLIPLRNPSDRPDSLSSLVEALAGTAPGETAVIQILFEEVRAPWAEHAMNAVLSPDGTPFFIDAPEITTYAEEKCAEPLYAVVVRIAANSQTAGSTFERIRSLASSLAMFGAPNANELVPLGNNSQEALIGDILARRTRRSGMLLSLSELTSLVRFPGPHFAHPSLVRSLILLPHEVLGEGTPLGLAVLGTERVPVSLSEETRLQHVHVIGASGTGKSTLLERMIVDDIVRGHGIALLDPHSDLAEAVLARVPKERIQDVVLFDPGSNERTAGWNVLAARSEAERRVISSDLAAAMKRLSTSWGDQMHIVLGNAIDAILASPHGGTLVDLRRFLLDGDFRQALVSTIRDEHVVMFWTNEFQHLIGKRPQAPILTRLDTFLRSPVIREAVCETTNPIDFRDVIDNKRIFIAKLSQGLIGEENCALLGSLLLSAFHQAALSRQAIPETKREPFFIFADEFHLIATPSLANLFSGIRKHGIGIIVAHQSTFQIHRDAPEVERAVLDNAYTRIVFRVGEEDATRLARGMGDFNMKDFLSLRRGEAIVRVGSSQATFRLTTEPLPAIPREEAEATRKAVRQASIERHASRGTRPTTPPVPQRSETRKQPAKPTPVDPGRGGAIHKYLQSLIKEWAKREGYRAEIEKELPSGERVDVALFTDGYSIACEIAGITTVEQEAGNIGKCLEHGFDEVVAVSLDASFLEKLRRTLDDLPDFEGRSRVHLVTPEELLTLLRSREPAPIKAGRVAGYAVTVRQKDSPQDAEARHRTAAHVLLSSIRRMREKKS